MLPASLKYAGETHAILGMGASGMAAARLSRHLGAKVILLDDGNPMRPLGASGDPMWEGMECVTGKDALKCDTRFDLAILSPGIDPSWPLAQHVLGKGVRGVSEIEFAYQQTELDVIAITGTNGKTTTTGLIAHLLMACGKRTVPCGNYGRALADVVLAGEPLDVLTVEVSSFQLELIERFSPKVAVWMNFAPDHLDRHPSLEAYRAAKLRIFERQTASDTAVINGAEAYPTLAAQPVRFSAWAEDGEWTFKDGAICYHQQPVVMLAETKLRGRHNAENIMAALAAVVAYGLPLEQAAAQVASFIPPRHRCEVVATINGREFLNDSKATNIHAMESALRGQERAVVLIAGGKNKGLDYAPVWPLIREKTTDVFVIGEIRAALAETWPGAVPCADLATAVRHAHAAAVPGQAVLFAPGTSSFDMFTGYENRGDVFCQLVHQLETMP